VNRCFMALLAGGVAACASGEPDSWQPSELHLAYDGTCTATTPGGPGFTEVTLHNTAGQTHQATLVRLDDATPDSTIAAWYTRRDSMPPSGAAWIGGPGATPPGGSSAVMLHLSIGRYLALCLPTEPDSGSPEPPAMASFDIDSLPVPHDQGPPLTDAILQIGADSVTWLPTPAPGRRIVRISNEQPGTVTVWLTRLDDGDRPEVLGGISELGAGREGWITVTFRRGPHKVVVMDGARRAPEVVTGFVIE